MGGIMASVFDAAQYIINRKKRITAIKLQKLIYYCQAWSLIWDDTPLFSEKIEAWANGPVVAELFHRFKGCYDIPADAVVGDPEALTAAQKETIDGVLDYYGDKSTAWLVELTHMEDPWKNARKRAKALPGQKCDEVITLEEMANYYSGLLA
jgi:uncharacterized phage-associated protein